MLLGQADVCVLGVGEAPDRYHLIADRQGWPVDGIRGSGVAVLNGDRGQPAPARHVAGCKDVRCRGAEVRIDVDMTACVGLDAGNVKTEPDSVGAPADGDNGERRLDGALNTVAAGDHQHAVRRFLEAIDRSEALVDGDAGRRKGGCDRGRHVLVLGVEDARADLEEVDPRSKGGKDRRNLHPGCSRSDDEHRRRDGREVPGVAVRGRQLESGDRKPAALAADAEDDPIPVERKPVLGLDRVGVDEAGGAGVLVNGHSQRVEIVPQRRVDAGVLHHLAHPGQEPRVVEWFTAHVDAVEAELATFANQPRGVRERADGNRTVVCGHTAEGATRDEGRCCPEPGGAGSGDDARRPGADNQDVGLRGGRLAARAAAQSGSPCSSELIA